MERKLTYQVPEELSQLCRSGSVERLLNERFMVKVDLCCNPHAVAVSSDSLEAVRFSSSGKYYNLLPRLRPDADAIIPSIFAPRAAPTELGFNAHSVTVPDIQLCRW